MIKITGKVIKGDGYGKKLGFPTANIDRRQWVRDKMKMRFGVYAGVVQLLSGQEYKAGIVIGPLDKAGLPKIEAHLIGFKRNVYGQKLVLQVSKFLRPFRKFKSEQELIRAIRQDIEVINLTIK